MSAWWNLTKKEWRLGLPAFFVPVIAVIVIVSFSAYIGYLTGFVWEAILGVAFIATSLQIFYLVYYLLFSLFSERKKLHLWLHNPLPGYALLLAKLAAGMLSMLVTTFFTGALFLLALQLSTSIPTLGTWLDLTYVGFWSGVHFFFIAIRLGVLFLFYWIIFLLFTRFFGSFLSFVFTFITYIVLTSIYSIFSNSLLYEILTSWGEIQVSGITERIITMGNIQVDPVAFLQQASNMTIHLGSYMFEALVTVAIFFIASWLLDRKVEV